MLSRLHLKQFTSFVYHVFEDLFEILDVEKVINCLRFAIEQIKLSTIKFDHGMQQAINA